MKIVRARVGGSVFSIGVRVVDGFSLDICRINDDWKVNQSAGVRSMCREVFCRYIIENNWPYGGLVDSST